MRFVSLAFAASLAAGRAPAPRPAGTLFHPELLTLGDRPTLIDCERGFRPALVTYFADHAPRDGVPAGSVSVTALARESDRWIAHFEVQVGTRRYRGFIYLEPPIGDDDDMVGPPDRPRAGRRDCSAAFAEAPLSAASEASLETAYRALCAHFGVAP